MTSPKPSRAYLAIAGPLAEDLVNAVHALAPDELERLEAVLRPLAAWRVPAVAEHAAALLEALADLRALRQRVT
jgi:hypothetical protein